MKKEDILELPVIGAYFSDIYVHDSVFMPIILSFFLSCLIAWLLKIDLLNPLYYMILIPLMVVICRGSHKIAYWLMR